MVVRHEFQLCMIAQVHMPLPLDCWMRHLAWNACHVMRLLARQWQAQAALAVYFQFDVKSWGSF